MQIGGGVRSLAAVESYLELGAARVVLGTAAVRDPALVREAALRWPGRVVVALDARDGEVALDGWEQRSGRTAREWRRASRACPWRRCLYTDVARDGTRAGPNLAATRDSSRRAAGSPSSPRAAVGSLDDLRALAAIPGVTGASWAGRSTNRRSARRGARGGRLRLKARGGTRAGRLAPLTPRFRSARLPTNLAAPDVRRRTRRRTRRLGEARRALLLAGASSRSSCSTTATPRSTACASSRSSASSNST